MVDDLAERIGVETERMSTLLGPRGYEPAPVGPYFVWSGPLCGGFLVKGVFREEFDEKDLWFDREAPCRVFESSRGGRQGPAPGGVYGVDLFHTIYDCSDEPPFLTPELLASADARLADAGLLKDAWIYVLPHYD